MTTSWPNPYGDELPADGWEEFVCVASKSVVIMVRKATGGEEYGHTAGHQRARAGDNLCVRPENGHRWTMGDDSLYEFYVPKSGRRPQQKKEKQATTRKEGSSVGGGSWFEDDDNPLFKGCGKEGDTGDGTPQGECEEAEA